MREICMSGSTRGQWVAAQPSPTVLLYRPIPRFDFRVGPGEKVSGRR
jgi:hypothetical protein